MHLVLNYLFQLWNSSYFCKYYLDKEGRARLTRASKRTLCIII